MEEERKDTAVGLNEILASIRTDYQLNEKQAQRLLDVLTESALATPEWLWQARRLNFHSNPDGKTITIQTSDGIILNNILPRCVDIYDEKRSHCVHDLGEYGIEVFLDMREICRGGDLGKISLAHEFGHAIYPGGFQDYQKKLKLGDKQTSNDLSFKERISSFVRWLNLTRQQEVKAWDAAKIIADFLGVDEMVFETERERCLATHRRLGLYEVHFLTRLLRFGATSKGEIDESNKFRVYDPLNSRFSFMSFAELMEITGIIERDKLLPKTEKVPKRKVQEKSGFNSLQKLDEFLSNQNEFFNVCRRLQKIDADIRPEDLRKWFEGFCRGVEYVYKKYGTIAENIWIAESVVYEGENRDDTITYIPDKGKDAIVITYNFLARSVSLLRKGTYSMSPHLSESEQMDTSVLSSDFPIILGIEEAFHSFYLKTGQGKPGISGQYKTDPVEVKAGEVIKLAIKEFKIPTFKSTVIQRY